MQRVTSRNNPRFREMQRLLSSARDRRKAGKCVLEGEHLVSVYASRCGAPESLIVSDDALLRPSVRELVERHSGEALIVPTSLFDTLAMLPADVGVVAVVATPQPVPAAPADFCLLLEEVQDPGNIGSMLRSAAAAGVGQVLLSKRCAFAWSPKVLRAGQGAHFCVDIHEDVDLVAWTQRYRDDGGLVVATVAAGGTALYDLTLTGRVAVVVGNEGAGLSPLLTMQANVRATIPMPGGIGSLNAAAAAAVCLFECVRQRGMRRAIATATLRR